MEYLKETNKNLINLRASIIAVMVVLTSGLAGLLLIEINTIKLIILLFIGIYFDIVFLGNVFNINDKITTNLKELKNECK